MKRVIIGLALAVMVMAGCSLIDNWTGGDDYTKLPGYKYFDDQSCKGYGAVNYWWTIDPEDAIEAVAAAGADVYHIEFFGWADSRTDLGTLTPIYRDYLRECRKRNVVLFTSIFNDNSHLAKYGNTPWRPSVDYLLGAVNLIISEGPEGQIVQPVGETQTSTGRSFEQQARSRLAGAGFKTCYNNGSRPSSPPAGWTYAAFHPFHTNTRIPGGAVCVTDTGTILNELGGFNWFVPERVTAYANTVLKTWGRPLILYGFQHKVIDYKSVEALGNIE